MLHPRVTVVALAAVLGLLAAAGASGQTVTMTGASVSVAEARDGVEITLGYQINSTMDMIPVDLRATLTAPNGQLVTDVGDQMMMSVIVSSGTRWYYRSFLINLPPGAQTGSSIYYDVNCTAAYEAESSSYTLSDALKMLAPVQLRIPILMYHKVGDATYSVYWNTTSMLHAQMAALQAYGYTALTSRELMDIRAGLRSAPAKPIMITFDGGYQNFHQHGLPIVSSYGFKPVLFQLTGYMGMDNSWDGDNNPVIMFMTSAELADCWATGMVDVQNHTVTHPNMTTITAAQTTTELLNANATIETCCPGAVVDAMCYPYGSYNATTKQRVRDNGFFSAYAAWGGIETNCVDKYALKRIEVSSTTTTDYNPSSPSKFFFNMIGSGLVIPTITINSVQFLDPDTGTPVTSREWGQTVRVRVTATNSGSTADAGCSVRLSTSAGDTIYDSHATTPAQDVTVLGWSGQRAFDFLCTVPVDAPATAYTANVYFRDKLYVLGFKSPVSYAAFSVTSNLIDLGTAKTCGDNTWASVKGATITAARPDFFYVETANRALGMRVERAGHGFSAGMKVDLAGQTRNSAASGERCIAATYIESAGSGSIAPLTVSNAGVGGSSSGYQNQVWGWQKGVWSEIKGLNNTGLLVRTCGRVLSIDSGSRVMTIDDGSEANLKCTWTDTVAVDPEWDYVVLTGISGCEKVSDQLGRLMLVTSAQGQ